MKHAFRALRPERFNAYLAEPSTGSFKSLVLAVSVSQCEAVSSELLLDKINKFPIWRIGKIVSVSYLCIFESMFLITHENSANVCTGYLIWHSSLLWLCMVEEESVGGIPAIRICLWIWKRGTRPLGSLLEERYTLPKEPYMCPKRS